MSENKRATEEERIQQMARQILEEVAHEYRVDLRLEEVGDPLDLTPAQWTLKCKDLAIQKRLGGPPDLGKAVINQETINLVCERLKPEGSMEEGPK